MDTFWYHLSWVFWKMGIKQVSLLSLSLSSDTVGWVSGWTSGLQRQYLKILGQTLGDPA